MGLYELGKKDGFGKYTWSDGSYFIGEWKDNKIHGMVINSIIKGIYYWADGRKFAGEWKNSKMNGFGIFYWKDGRVYKGEYKEDKKHSFGMYYGVDNKKYEGNWEFGSQKHLGKYTKKDGSLKLGYWDDNKISKAIVNHEEVHAAITEIDNMVSFTLEKVELVLQGMKLIFISYLPNVEFEGLLGM